MPLMPVTNGPLVGMIRDLVRVDPDGASELMRLSLFEVLADDVERYGDGIRERVGKHLTQHSSATRRALVRAYVAKREAGQPVTAEMEAAAFFAVTDTAIAKAWDKRKHPRNKAGRFVHTLSGDGSPGQMQDEAHRAIVDMKQERFLRNGSKVTLHGHKLDAQGQFSGNFGNAEISADSNLRGQIKGSGIAPTHIAIDPKQTNVPEGTPGTLFDLTSRLAGEKTGVQAANAAPVDNPGQLAGALDTVMRDTNGTDRKAYRRMAATGQAIQRFSTPGSGAHLAGQVTQAIGQFGPEAENVLGRPIARTAYRYRGTERKPNSMLVNEVADATTSADDVATAAVNPDARRQLAGVVRGGRQGLAMGTAGYYGGAHELDKDGAAERKVDPSSDQLDLRLRGDTAVGYFLRKIPKPEQYELSIEAGKVPPSQGAIIDANGEIVTEAMGYGEDHYLPFDLKNLKALNGGQYVRTRAAGGPTTEDIYTGLLTGARQLQVVSNSGVFTVEFDPDLRGGRRYSDKARQMVGRYQALLDRIQRNAGSDNQLMSNDIPDERKQELRAEAYAATGYHEDDAKTLYAQKLKRERLQARFTGPTDAELTEAATHQVEGQLARQQGNPASGQRKRELITETVKELKAKRNDEMVRALRLDGVGYSRALDSLQQEFPYFIRSVDYETTAEFDGNRRHTPPGRGTPAPDASRHRADPGFIGGGNITTAEQRRGPKPDSSGGSAGGRDERGRPTTPSTTPSGHATTVRRNAAAAGELADLSFVPAEGSKLSDLKGQRDDLARKAADKLTGLAAFPQYAGEPLPAAEEMEDPTRTAGAKQAFSATVWDRNKVRSHLAEAMKPENKDQRQLLAQGLEQLNREVDAGVSAGIEPHYESARQQFPAEQVNDAIASLRRLDAADQPFAEQAENPALYSPDTPDAPPQHFDQIDKLGTNMANYEGFIQHVEANSRKAPFFLSGLNQLEAMNPNQRRDHVRNEVQAYLNTIAWGKQRMSGDMTSPPPKPGSTLTDNYGDARDIAAQDETHPSSQQYKQLLGLQQAWSFLHGLEIANTVGGDAGPKAPEQASGQQHPLIPQFRSGNTTPEDAVRRREDLGKRDRPKVIVHPPGSPVAKALAKKLATSRRPDARRR